MCYESDQVWAYLLECIVGIHELSPFAIVILPPICQ
jgi:hypothetical protein